MQDVAQFLTPLFAGETDSCVIKDTLREWAEVGTFRAAGPSKTLGDRHMNIYVVIYFWQGERHRTVNFYSLGAADACCRDMQRNGWKTAFVERVR